jgi:hypothetical protein
MCGDMIGSTAIDWAPALCPAWVIGCHGLRQYMRTNRIFEWLNLDLDTEFGTLIKCKGSVVLETPMLSLDLRVLWFRNRVV